MKKMLLFIVLFMLVSATFSSFSHLGNARVLRVPLGEEDIEPLPMQTMENVTLLENGACLLEIEITLSSSDVADIYRKMLGAPQNASIGDELPVPENTTEIVDTGEGTVEIPIPVKEEFYRSLMKEQLLSLGINASICSSFMVPRGRQNEFRLSMEATGSLAVFNVSQKNPDDLWEVALGPFNTTGITGLTLSKIVFTQSMLGLFGGKQEFESSWLTRIILPAKATLLNGNELQQNWKVDVGGGTCLSASTSLEGASTLRLEELMTVTEEGITASPETLRDSFLDYKRFEVRYSMPSSVLGPIEKTSADVNTNWNFETGWMRLPEIPLSYTFKKGDLSLSVRLSFLPSFRIEEDIGWKWHWQWAWPPIQFDRFWANTTLQYSLGARFEINASYDGFWEWPIYERPLVTFYFCVGVVPVWIELRLGVDVTLGVTAEASFVFNTNITGSVSAGARWDKANPGTGWEQFFPATQQKPAWDLAWYTYGHVTVTSSIRFRLEFMFYSCAGPFVELEPYLQLDATAIAEPANSAVNIGLGFGLKINIGVKFDEKTKEILSALFVPREVIEDHRWTVYDERWLLWNDTWILNHTSPLHLHDVGVTGIVAYPQNDPERGFIVVGEVAVVNVTVMDSGYFDESSNVSLFRNDLLVGCCMGVELMSQGFRNVIFNWTTSGLAAGNYTLAVDVSPVEGETYPDNNEMNKSIELVDPIDIALTDLTLPSKEVYAGQTINFTTRVENVGSARENFTVVAYYNDTVFEVESGDLQAGQGSTFVFHWNTTGLSPNQTCGIWTEVNTTHFDLNVSNNRSEFALVSVRLFADLTNDGAVDLKDITACLDAFSSFQAHPRWNQSADLDQNSRIDMGDIVLVLLHFGTHL